MDMDKTGGPAFPCMPPQDTAAGSAVGYPYPDGGMTLRDYFAAKAMAALIVAPFEDWPTDIEGNESVSTAAYEMADAMLKERAK